MSDSIRLIFSGSEPSGVRFRVYELDNGQFWVFAWKSDKFYSDEILLEEEFTDWRDAFDRVQKLLKAQEYDNESI